jgi:phage terminase small subunit
MRNALTGRQTGAIRLKLEGAFFDRVEAWRRSHPKIPSRTDAIRQLVERGLTQDLGSNPRARGVVAKISGASAA